MHAGNMNWQNAALAAVVLGAAGKGVCEFPKDAGLVEVTPDQKNAGWAMAPDMACEPGMYCPYACPP
jgi:hypothetical protein